MDFAFSPFGRERLKWNKTIYNSRRLRVDEGFPVAAEHASYFCSFPRLSAVTRHQLSPSFFILFSVPNILSQLQQCISKNLCPHSIDPLPRLSNGLNKKRIFLTQSFLSFSFSIQLTEQKKLCKKVNNDDGQEGPNARIKFYFFVTSFCWWKSSFGFA